jgi:dTDP-4-dehydrorhamnose reductase
MVPSGKETVRVILVFGARGLLGASLCPALESMGYRVQGQSRDCGAQIQCDPMDSIAIKKILDDLKPTAVVNLIALSNVDFCQDNLAAAYLANCRNAEVLVSAVEGASSRPHLIQISTDHLYNGIGPHAEGFALPSNVYALTKFAGELAALRVGATVMRTNFFGRSRSSVRKSFTDWIYEELASRRTFTVFDDVLFSAVHMSTLAACVAKAVELRHAGVFNVGAHNGLSKASFARHFANNLGLDSGAMTIGSVSGVKFAAPRPLDMRMDVGLFERTFDIDLPDMTNEIGVAADEYRNVHDAI